MRNSWRDGGKECNQISHESAFVASQRSLVEAPMLAMSLAFEEKINGFKKAALVKRHICVKDPPFVQLSEAAFMEKKEFSCMCFAIAEGPFSGVEEDRTWYMIIYYEPSKKAKAFY